MGNGASAKNKNTANTNSQPARNQATTPRRGGNNFQEVQVRPADDHVTQDYRGTPPPLTNQQSPTHNNMAQREQGANLANQVGKRRTEAHKNSQKALEINEKNPEIGKQSGEDIVFETFEHESGREYQCLYTGGMRFYLDDWHSKEWQPFPERWYKQGKLNTNTVTKDNQTRRGQGASTSRGGNQSQPATSSVPRNRDDREGVINHPRRGKITTYMFNEKQYSHCYYDKESGSWLRLPIGWELHHELIKNMVDQVEEALPHWNDRLDILAALRACNYSADECISMYFHLEGDDWLKVPRTSKEAQHQADREIRLAVLEKKVRELEKDLQQEEKGRREAEEQLNKLQEQYSTISAEAKIATTQVEAMQSSRPKTARPKTPKTSKAPPPGSLGIFSDDLDELNNKAKNLHKSHVHLKMDVERHFGTLGKMIKEALSAVSQIKHSESGQMKELEEVRALYQKEALQRKLLYNQLQELRGNIRVFCRARKDTRTKCCLTFPSDQDITITSKEGSKKTFSYDKVFDTETTQDQIFEDTKAIVTSCVDGYNVCLMAYGQTGSGKTFTMMGPESNPGINIRAITELLKVCNERETITYTLKVSLVEIYNETVVDLLTADAKTVELKSAGNNIRMPNLTDHEVAEVKDIKHVMAMGDKNRTTASTKMNSTSSRSHLVLLLNVEGTDKVSGAVSRGVLTLCDLAGSERISKTEAQGQRLVEAAAINKSLSALGQVFTALRSSQLHVPYRNSKLTQILRPSLGGDAKACLFVNVSPDANNYPESCNTLDFGSNARQVALGQAKQNISKKGP
ncbi:uncharacterized protein [Haliotis cracherodii]|uniref:uncharacterized protein isoform X2 n=1 Tax=Haliotis cracherodii TaxID=6455 RepID=UPI0039E7E6F4